MDTGPIQDDLGDVHQLIRLSEKLISALVKVEPEMGKLRDVLDMQKVIERLKRRM